MRLSTYCWAGVGLYVVLSVIDLTLTYVLLKANPQAFESNPLAAVWLERHGWSGLAVFKFAVVLVFVGAMVLLIHRRPAVGAGVVTFGCSVLLTVAVYSQGLIRQTHEEQARNATRGFDR